MKDYRRHCVQTTTCSSHAELRTVSLPPVTLARVITAKRLRIQEPENGTEHRRTCNRKYDDRHAHLIVILMRRLTHDVLNSSCCGSCSSSIDVLIVEVARRKGQLGSHLGSQCFTVGSVAKVGGRRNVLRALLLQQELLRGCCLLCQCCLVCRLQPNAGLLRRQT